MDAETFEARTYRKSPRRGKTPSSKGRTAGKMRRRRKMKQGYNDRMDESMGGGDSMDATRKARRDESKGMEKSMGNRAYSRVQTMDAEFNAYDDDITERQEYLIEKLEGRVDKTMNRSQASDYIKRP